MNLVNPYPRIYKICKNRNQQFQFLDMSNTSNFPEAFREARNHGIVGPNVIANALPYVGGGLVLTAIGT